MFKTPDLLFGYFIQPATSPLIDSEAILWSSFIVSLFAVVYIFKTKKIDSRDFQNLIYRYRLYVANFRILILINRLQKLYKKERASITKLEKTIADISLEKKNAGEISNESSDLINENIRYWYDQKSFHEAVANKLTIYILELKKQRRELFLLFSVLSNILKTSGPKSRLKAIMKQFQKLVNSPGYTVIGYWQKSLNTASRRKDLEESYEALESHGFFR